MRKEVRAAIKAIDGEIERLTTVKQMLEGLMLAPSPRSEKSTAVPTTHRLLSKEARSRIAKAQQVRWAQYREEKRRSGAVQAARA